MQFFDAVLRDADEAIEDKKMKEISAAFSRKVLKNRVFLDKEE